MVFDLHSSFPAVAALLADELNATVWQAVRGSAEDRYCEGVLEEHCFSGI